MRKLKLLCIVYVIFAVLLSAVPSYAASEDASITNYDMRIQVGENNVYQITETIDINFAVQKHGIYRDIPLVITKHESGVSRPYGYGGSIDAKTSNDALIDNVSVQGGEYRLERSGFAERAMLRVRIGDPDETVTGYKKYTISYSYDMGADNNKGFDDFYFNLVGQQWEYPIERLTFGVEMPKDFDHSMINLTAGEYGSVDNSGFTYDIQGNTVTGSYNNVIQPGSGATIKLGLPDGYFIGARSTVDYSDIITGVISALLLLITLLLWFFFGRDEKPVETIEFHPPQNLNSAEIGYYIDGKVEDKDIMSLFIYWANQGYINIIDDEGKYFKLQKLREFGSGRGYEKTLFDKLFEKSDTIAPEDISPGFYSTMNSVKTQVPMGFEAAAETKLYTKASVTCTKIAHFLASIAVTVGFYYIVQPLAGSVLISIIVSFVLANAYNLAFRTITGSIELRNSNTREKTTRKIILGVCSAAVVTLLVILVASYMGLRVMPFVIAAVASLVMHIITVFINKRTKYGTEVLGKLLGFKNFLMTAEKDRLEELVKDDPQYFYNVLPYAYVLGVSDIWAKKLEAFAVEPPTWYSGGHIHTFSMIYFMNSMNNGLGRYQTQMNMPPQSSSGGGSFGGFGGGGFSGGGGGGGGGGGW